MFKRKRKVGRPSNKELRRERNFKIFSIIGIFFVLTFSVYSLSGYLRENIDSLKGQVKYGRNGDYCNEKNTKSGSLIIGDSRVCQLYNYNNSSASYNATWGGHYGYGGETYQIDTVNKRAKMRSYAKLTIKKTGNVNIFIFATVNDYNGGNDYSAPLNNVVNLAKNAYTWTYKYNGKTVHPKVYIISLVGSKGVNVDAFNNALQKAAKKSSKFDYIGINDLVGSDGYLSDNLHYTDETCRKILERMENYGLSALKEKEDTFETNNNKNTNKSDVISEKKVNYKIYYDANGGTNAPSTQTYTNIVGEKISSKVPTKNGYQFVNWKDSKSNKVFYPDEIITNISHDLNLVAQYKANTYTVMYGANGGTNAPETQKFLFNSKAQLSYQIPKRDGYDFMYWKHSTSDRRFLPGDKIPDGWGSFILIAQWKESNGQKTNEYKIYYNANGGTNAPSTQTFEYNKKEHISSQVPSKEGYTFKGWKNSSSSRVLNPGDVIPSNWEDTTLIAIWEKVENVQKYKITYNANGGKFGLINEQFVYNENYKITSQIPSKEGYTFVNWKHNTSNKIFRPGNQIPTDWKDFTLIAQYRKNIITITYDSAGGKINLMKDKTWGLDGTKVTHGGKQVLHRIEYGKTLGKYGLADPNSKSELNLTKKGYKIVKNKEWICTSGCTTNNKIFNEKTMYKASDLCNASKSDCTVVLKVNWQKK